MTRRHELGLRLVLELDSILTTMIKNNLHGSSARLFNIRMRTYDRLPARVRKELGTPWYLERDK